MLANGQYAVWFRTPLGEGTGVVMLEDGTVTGRDTVIAYTGRYRQAGDAFTADISIKRHSPGQLSVFGIDDVDITLEGKSSRVTASCRGTALQAPGMAFEVTMIRMAD